MKTPKTISLNDEVLKDIRIRSTQYGFNFSEWAENRYKDEFMNEDKKKEEIAEYKNKIIILENEIKQSATLKESYKKVLSRSEIRFIKAIPLLLFEGKELGALCKRFNLMFKKNIDLPDFQKMVEFFKNDKKRQKY